VALALWQASEAIWGYRNRAGAKRVRKQVTSWAMAVIYVALGVSAASVALGSRSSSSQSQQQATSGVLAWPAGRVIVVVAGLIIIGVGVAHVVKGVKKSFAEEIDTSTMSAGAREGVARLGQIGYVAKGVALGLVGGLLSYATLTFDRQKQRAGRRDADDPGAAVRQVPAHGGGARIRGLRRVRDPPVAIPPDVTRAGAG
jgi:succinate dehydrogenase/fumarate reductase cytochrome b subunit